MKAWIQAIAWKLTSLLDALFRVVWEYTALAMNDIQLPFRFIGLSFMAHAVYSQTNLNAIQY